MHITSLQAENIKRLKVVHIAPDGAIVTISGRNGQGKTSVLDSIEMALGGTSSVPKEPIRRGSKKARIICTLDNGLAIKRTFTENGSALTVEDGDGKKFNSPQSMLDALVGKLTFDPLAFTRFDARKQVDTIRQLVGLDFTALDAQRKAAYENRTVVNRDVTRLEGQLSAMTHHADAPKTPVVVSDLVMQLRRAEAANQELNRGWELSRDKRRMAGDKLAAEEREAKRLNDVIEDLEKRLADAQAAAGKQAMKISAARTAIESLGPDEERPALEGTAPIQEQIVSAEQINRKVSANATREATSKALRVEREKADKLSSVIDDLDSQKRLALEQAKFPIPGMAFDETGVTLNGLPFEQASSAEQLRASVAIGLAANPKLRVMLLRDGSLLDEEGMEMLAMIATENDAQLWVEKVSDEGGVGIVIEDGQVAEAVTEEVATA